MATTAPSQEPDAKSIARNTGKLSLLTMGSRILGMVREQSRSAFLGIGTLGDAFSVAFIIPNLFRRLFAEGSMSTGLIPVLKDYLHEGDKAETRAFLSAVFTVLLVLLVLVTATGMLTADQIVRLFKSDPAETAVLTQIMFPFLALVSFAAFFQGMLNAVHVFGPSGFAPIIFNVVFIILPSLVLPFFDGNYARAMALAVVVGGLLQAIVQLPAVLKAGFRFGIMNPLRAFMHPGLRKVALLVAPTILGMAAYELNTAISTALAPGDGSVTALQLSIRLQELVLGVFIVSISTVALPALDSLYRNRDFASYSDRIRRSLDLISLITIPVALFSLLGGADIVGTVYRYGAFGAKGLELTTGIFAFHMLGLFFIGQNRLLAAGFFARQDTRSPTVAGLVSVGVNILAAFLLVGPLGASGIALALSIAALANMILLIVFMGRNPDLDLGHIGKSGLYALRIVALSAIALVPAFFVQGPLRALTAESDLSLVLHGVPMLGTGLVYGLGGLLGLFVTQDAHLAGLTRRFRKKS